MIKLIKLGENCWQFTGKGLLLGSCLLAPLAAEACSSCGCTLSSEWIGQGMSGATGIHLDLRYDFLDQPQLRTGKGLAKRADYPLPNDREVERRTINRYTTAALDYAPSRDWGINVQVPYIVRSHTTVAEGDNNISSSHSSSLGDVRVLGRYQGFPVGIQLGLKLPTGSHEYNFNGGPQAGSPLDRGLQPGSGSTDLLLGIYKAEALNQDFDYFAQALIQTPVSTQDNFRPGSSLNLNLGLSYVGFGSITPQLQINARSVGRDHGIEADTENSGGTLVDLSPGVTMAISKQTRLYGFVQLPIYQRVGGLQLAPRWTASVGLNYAF
ncbi:MAG TPA: hypothetical protein VIE91_04640 [Methylophilaceae bacterium]|jgi:hypothetical protein